MHIFRINLIVGVFAMAVATPFVFVLAAT